MKPESAAREQNLIIQSITSIPSVPPFPEIPSGSRAGSKETTAQLPPVLPFTSCSLLRTGNTFFSEEGTRAGVTDSSAVSVSPGLLVTCTRSLLPPGTFWSRVASGEGQGHQLLGKDVTWGAQSHQHSPGRCGQLDQRGRTPKQCHTWQHGRLLSLGRAGTATPPALSCRKALQSCLCSHLLSTATRSHSELVTTGLERTGYCQSCTREGNLLESWHKSTRDGACRQGREGTGGGGIQKLREEMPSSVFVDGCANP